MTKSKALNTRDVKESIHEAEIGQRFWQDGNVFYKISEGDAALDWDWYIEQGQIGYLKTNIH